MEVVVIGLNHKSAPIEVREKLAFSGSQLPQALAELNRCTGVSEAVIVSTCNRTELYVTSEEGLFGNTQAAQFLSEFRGPPRDAFESHLYEYTGIDAVRHLFRVISSLDSMVLGETQILSQVKQAYMEAFEHACTGKFFNRLFQTAFRVGKKVHTASSISERKVSVSSVAVDFAERIFEDFSGKTAMVIGAGEMSELTLEHLREHGIGATVVANRTHEKAVGLAERIGGRAVRFDAIEEELSRVDIVIASSGAPHFVIEPAQVRRAMRTRKGRPILFIDIALPRDINPDVNRLDNVYVYGLDDLQTVVMRNLDAREKEIEKCTTLIDKEVEEFTGQMRLYNVEPLITRLHERVEQIGRSESERAIRRLGDLSEEQKQEIAYMADRLVHKILHKPLEILRSDAKNGGDGRYIDAVRHMFGMEEDGESAEEEEKD